MNRAFELTVEATKQYSEQVRRASSILLETFNLNNFYYYKISNSGDFFLFDDNSDVIDCLDSQQFFFKHPHYCHPRYHKNALKIENTSDNPLLKDMDRTKRYFLDSQFNLSLSLVKKTADGVEEFGFHSAQYNSQQISFLLNHQAELRLFAQWFLKNCTTPINFLQENAINLEKALGKVFNTNRIWGSDPFEQKKREFLNKLGINSDSEVSLSPADLDLTELILLGYSASQIGAKLFRSKRTIEHRIENLKDRLQCTSKRELIEKIKDLDNHGGF